MLVGLAESPGVDVSLRVQGLGFRAYVLRFRVWGFKV